MSTVSSNAKKLFAELVELGLWKEIQTELADSIASELNGISTPEDAFKTAVRYQMVSDVFCRIESKLS